MKKIASIAIALMMVLSVSAMPIKRQAKTVIPDRQNAEVVKKAPTQTQTATGDPTFISALSLNGYSTYTTGDFWLYLFDDNDACVAIIDINTGSDNSIVGTHTIGDGSFYGAYFYTEAGGTMYTANYGGLSIICTGTESVETGSGALVCPKYDVVCTNWYDATNEILVSFKGSAYCIATKKSDTSTYLPTDTKVNATEVVIDQFLDINTDSVWMWTIEGQDATATYALGKFVSYSNDIEGTYFFPNGVYDSNISNNFQTSYSYVTLNGGTNWVNPTRVYGYLFETESGDYEFSFYATVSGSVYHFTNITEEDPYQYDESANFSAAFTNPLVTQYGTNQYFLDADGDTDATKGISLFFYTNGTDADITIPTGKYNINDTYAAGTVLASEGYHDDILYQSYAYKSTDGVNVDNVWFIVSGTVTVAKSGKTMSVTVNGTNSLGKTVYATISGTPATGIEEVEAAEVDGTAKTMENGQLVIIRNGVRYNAQGAVIK